MFQSYDGEESRVRAIFYQSMKNHLIFLSLIFRKD